MTLKERYELVIRWRDQTEKFDPCNSYTNTLIELVCDMAEEINRLEVVPYK